MDYYKAEMMYEPSLDQTWEMCVWPSISDISIAFFLCNIIFRLTSQLCKYSIRSFEIVRVFLLFLILRTYCVFVINQFHVYLLSYALHHRSINFVHAFHHLKQSITSITPNIHTHTYIYKLNHPPNTNQIKINSMMILS